MRNIYIFYSPFIIPYFDVVRVYLHRICNGKNPFLPYKHHIHHKLLAIEAKYSHAHHHVGIWFLQDVLRDTPVDTLRVTSIKNCLDYCEMI